MPRFLPFSARLAHPAKGESYSDLVTHSFADLALVDRQERAARHPHNFVRFESLREVPGDRPGEAGADRAAAALERAVKENRIATAGTAYFLLEVESEGQRVRGFVGMLELAAKNRPALFEVPHETEVKDRLKQLDACEIQTAPVAVGYRTDESGANQIETITRKISARKPLCEIEYPAGVRHRIWAVAPGEHEIEPLLSRRSMVMLGGAGRYKAALKNAEALRRKDRAPSPFQSYNFIMAWMVDLEREPYRFKARHWALKSGAVRLMDGQTLLTKLEDHFEIDRYKLTQPGAKEAELVNLRDEMEFMGRLNHTFGLYVGDRAYYLMYLRDAESYERMSLVQRSRRWKRLDVSVLDAIVFEGLLGLGWDKPEALEKFSLCLEPRRAVSLVDEGFADAAFLLNDPLPQHLIEIAESNEPIASRCVTLAQKPIVGPIMARIAADEMVGDDVVRSDGKGSRNGRASKVASGRTTAPAKTARSAKPARRPPKRK